MDLHRHVTRTLHDEHMATVALLERLEGALLTHRKGGPPPPGDPDVNRLLGDFAAAVENEIGSHFAFEEAELFPRLEEVGDGAIGEILAEEHAVILPLGERLTNMAHAARRDGFDDASWAEFRRLAGELIERMIAHVQKEEMGLLPALEDLVDDAEDALLVERLMASR